MSSSSPREHCERLLQQFAALSGFCDADMTRDESWHAMQLGRAIERTQFLAGILERSLVNDMAARAESLEWLLEVGDSLNAYRQGYPLPAHLAPVLALLLGDGLHPGSLAFLGRQVNEQLAALLPDGLDTQWQLAPLPTPQMDRVALRAGLMELEANIADLADVLSLRFHHAL